MKPFQRAFSSVVVAVCVLGAATGGVSAASESMRPEPMVADGSGDRSSAVAAAEEAELAESERPRAAGPYEPYENGSWERSPRHGAEDASIVIGRYIEERWPETQSGVWMSPDEEPHVTVAFAVADDQLESLTREIRRHVPGDYELDVVAVKHSEAELVAAELALVALLQREDGTGPLSQALSRGADLARTGTAVDLINNGLTMFLGVPETAVTAMRTEKGTHEEAVDAALTETIRDWSASLHTTTESLNESIGVPVDIKLGSVVLDGNCSSKVNCYSSMRGGLKLHRNGSTATLCTAGPTVFGGSGRRFILTAGHCGNLEFHHENRLYGNTDRRRFSATPPYLNIDAQRVVNTNTNWSHRGLTWVEPSDQRVVRNYFRVGDLRLNWTVGNTGAVSSVASAKRGVITNLNYRPSPDSPNTYVLADYCATGGDSGASIFRDNSIAGIHTGRPVGVTCTSGHYAGAYFSHIDLVLSDLNVFLITE